MDGSNPLKSGFSSHSIMKLGDDLAVITNVDDQIKRLVEFLQRNFDFQVHIWLNNPPKSSQYTSPTNFPLALESRPIKDSLSTQGYACERFHETHFLVLPLTRGDADIGKMVLQAQEPFEPNAIKKLKDMTSIAGLVIFATIQTHLQNWRQKQLALVREVSRQISQITDLDLLTSQITQLVQETFQYSYVAVFLIDPESQRLKFQASAISEQNS